MNAQNRQIQDALTDLGYAPGPIDGIAGPRTEAATRAWLAAGMKAAPSRDGAALPSLPWMVEMKSVFGLHETRDNAALRKWLRSDGPTLGDPDALPWCGDAVETAIRNSLPMEPFTGPLEDNPYWARNWTGFGRSVVPSYGAVAVFARGSAGHVGFLVGQDATHFHVLGGNQGDAVSVVRIAKDRLLATRWPLSWRDQPAPLPTSRADKIPTSTNEF